MITSKYIVKFPGKAAPVTKATLETTGLVPADFQQ